LIVLDLRVGEELACDLCEPLMQAAPGAAVVIFTAFEDRALIDACRRRGVRGVLLKDAYGIDLVKAFRSACNGRTVLDPRLEDGGDELAARATAADGFDRLTEREHQVLRLLSRGLTARQIAEDMSLAVNTVRSYTQEIFSKLRVGNRVQAVAAARRLRLI
jgi:DNA-binding NarL/FixJ family response regulator